MTSILGQPPAVLPPHRRQQGRHERRRRQLRLDPPEPCPIRSVTCSNSGHHRRTATLGPAAVTIVIVSTTLNDQMTAAPTHPCSSHHEPELPC